MKFLENEKLNKHTSFRIGGPAQFFCVVKNMDQLQEALKFAKIKKLPVTIIGAGSNILILDQGIKGLVIKTTGLNSININGTQSEVEAGVPLTRIISDLTKANLGGLEFLAGIPGSLGGAVVMNAGAWGNEIGKYVISVTVINRSGQEKVIPRKKLKFGYRKSLLQKRKYILTSIKLKLKKRSAKAIKEKIKKVLALRKEKQPIGSPNCGSTFKNPRGLFAAKLIEDSGCKGMRIGDAQVSPKHANFIINLGEASAKDVTRLMQSVQSKVRARFGIELEPEVKIVVKSTNDFVKNN